MSIYPITFTVFYWLGAGHIFCLHSREKVTQAHKSLGPFYMCHHRKHTLQTWQRFANFNVCKNHLGEPIKIKLGFLEPILRVWLSKSRMWSGNLLCWCAVNFSVVSKARSLGRLYRSTVMEVTSWLWREAHLDLSLPSANKQVRLTASNFSFWRARKSLDIIY